MTRFDPLPADMQALPVDARGIPVPWFVDWPDGKPDFRVVDGRKLSEGWARELCWLCGRRLFAFRAWIIGPVSMINRCTGEPPAHLDCARVALTRCPFLSNPGMARSASSGAAPGGALVAGNSGVSAAWVTKGRGGEMFNPGNGTLFRLHEAHSVEWFHRGARASDEAVRAAFDAAADGLREADRRYGPAAMANLERRIAACARWLPG